MANQDIEYGDTKPDVRLYRIMLMIQPSQEKIPEAYTIQIDHITLETDLFHVPEKERDAFKYIY